MKDCTIRGKERKKYPAECCEDCKLYFSNENKERMEKVSKHRIIKKRSITPPGFWDVGLN